MPAIVARCDLATTVPDDEGSVALEPTFHGKMEGAADLVVRSLGRALGRFIRTATTDTTSGFALMSMALEEAARGASEVSAGKLAGAAGLGERPRIHQLKPGEPPPPPAH